MQKKLLRAIVLLLSSFSFFNSSIAQVTLGPSPYTQNFDAIAAGLPAGWTVRTGSSATSPGTTAALATAATSWASTSGNFRNVAAVAGLTVTTNATDQGTSTNRALAVRQTGAFGDAGASFVLELANTSGMSSFGMTFKLQSLDGSVSGRTTSWKVDYATGASPTTFTPATTTPAALSTTLSAAGWGSTDVSVDFGSALDNINDIVWIRIVALSASTGSGSRPTTAIDDVSVSFGAGDATPPVFTSTYPKITNLKDTGCDLLTNLNEPGTTYFVVLPDGAPAPTALQVKNNQDASGNATTGGGPIVNLAATTEYSFSITGLTQATQYDLYVVAEDATTNLQTAPVELNILTNTSGDNVPPVFADAFPQADSVSANSLAIHTELDEAGTTYFVVLPSADAEPTSDQIKAGTDASGIPVNLSGAIIVTAANQIFSMHLAGLTPSTAYSVYVVSEDNVPNLQPAPIVLPATTGPLFTENFNSCNGTSSFSGYSVSGDQVWGCVDFGYNGTKGVRMNGFNNTDIQNEDWLISPVVELGASPAVSFLSQFSFAGNSLQLKISTTYPGSGDPTAFDWDDLDGHFPTVAAGSSSTSNADWTLSNVDLSAYAGKTVHVAFVYTSTTTAASRWTVDEFSVNDGLARYITATPTALTFLTSGQSKSYGLSAVNLEHDVTVTAPAGFEVSRDNTTFSTSISYTAAEVNAGALVYVDFNVADAEAQTYSGAVSNMSDPIGTTNVSVTGTDKSQTFDIATYNLEFFASNVKDDTGVEFGPLNDTLQVNNVSAVMHNIDADIYGVEEVSNDTAFAALVAKMPGYEGLLANRWSYSFQSPDPHFPPQKTGFIYNTSTVKIISSRVMFAAQYDSILAGTLTLPGYPDNSSSSFWSSGRLPFMVTLDVTIKGVTKRISVIDIHSKSGSAQDDYDRRKYDVTVLHDSLSAHYANDKVILTGDYNDDVDTSILPGAASSYKIFVDDTQNYDVLTYPLSAAGAYSFPNSTSFLDHIVITNELISDFVPNSVSIEDGRNYIASYLTTTSDHLPVSARFLWKADQTITFAEITSKTFGDPDFTLTATSTSGLPVFYTSEDPTIATVHDNTVTILKTGNVNLVASQAGNDNYEAAATVFRVLTITKANQTISFAVILDKSEDSDPFIIPASATSGLPVTFATTSDKIIIQGNQVTPSGPGRVIITASQPGDDDYNAAVSVNQSFCIKPVKPVITADASGTTLTSSSNSGNQWYLNGNAIAGATNQTYIATQGGLYTVIVKADDCASPSADTQSLIITGDIAVPDAAISIYPNPTTQYLQIRGLKNEPRNPMLTDLTGQAFPITLERYSDVYQANLQQLAQGIYLFQVRDERGLHRMKVIKQ